MMKREVVIHAVCDGEHGGHVLERVFSFFRAESEQAALDALKSAGWRVIKVDDREPVVLCAECVRAETATPPAPLRMKTA